MAKDTRIFRVTKRGKISYHTRTAVSGMFGTRLYSSRAGRPDIAKVEATNPEATAGWTDVTEEFRNPDKQPDLRCPYHKGYGGVRKPTRYNPAWHGSRCLCRKIYCAAHPEYPVHSDFCSHPVSDPETCDCRVLKKIFG